MNERSERIELDRLVRHWADLAALPESKTHKLEINVEGCHGWIHDKRTHDFCAHYLSTHTFYGSQHEHSTKLLRKCGFNVTVANWDEPNEQSEPPSVAKKGHNERGER